MLFNSYGFVLVFLPAAVLLFFVIGSRSRQWALSWLVLASLLFYAWWRPANLLIIAPSIVVNFVAARTLLRLGATGRASTARIVLALGVAFNVLFLGYFKYANFAVGAVNDLAGTSFVLEQIILPLGISFITFQKIAFLVDVQSRRVDAFTLREYLLFVLFFPQLIAGPIVHYRELMPQFRAVSCRFDKTNVSVGLTLFVLGLAKKVLIADQMAPFVSTIFGQAAAGGDVSLVPAWAAAVGFTLQIYFDFSGYTDMALGVARFFGVRLPPNFDSPLKASSIIDFWARWHMSLTRFLTAYIYNPMALAAARRHMATGTIQPGGSLATPGGFLQMLVLPTVVTMLISGIWHGAGYGFILWGLLHGVYLSINHGWRRFAGPRLRQNPAYEGTMTLAGHALTFGCVVISMVLFRSPTLPAAAALFRGMAGLGGVDAADNGVDLALFGLWVLGAALVAFICPNTLQLLERFEPALDWKPANRSARPWVPGVAWRPNMPWAAAISAVAALAALYLGGQTEFLYWQF